jgi:hypothetical protein
MKHLKQFESFSKNTRGKRKELKHNTETTSDIQKALEYLEKGFELVEDNTALEHPEGGYQKISKSVTNYFNKLK